MYKITDSLETGKGK